MEEKNLQEVKEKPMEEIKETETKETTEKIPKGYYLAKVPTEYGHIIALDNEQVQVEELLIKIANAVKDAGIMK